MGLVDVEPKMVDVEPAKTTSTTLNPRKLLSLVDVVDVDHVYSGIWR
jgi:hypothetical protein